MTSAPSSPAKLLLSNPAPFLFFTGKGGVGKTTLACATAIHLADAGQRVLLVSTDPASNLDEMLDTPLSDSPRSVKGVPGLWAMNIDPGNAADAYRSRVIGQMALTSSETEVSTVREQLSGACTTEIAAFDEFAGLLTEDSREFDRIVFDTAPTGHTLRLLSLPKAWTGFLANNDRGASCLGPHSGLKMQEGRFRAALAALANPAQTSIILVTRPDTAAIREAARTSGELADLGLSNQLLAVNGVFTASDPADPIARSMQRLCEEALGALPPVLQGLPQVRIPLRSFDMVGLAALRRVLEPDDQSPAPASPMPAEPDVPSLKDLIDSLSASETGLVMVMGKGGVGKTTVAAAIAVGLAQRGHSVHLSTTDPAAHISAAVDGQLEGLHGRPDRPQGRNRTLHRKDHRKPRQGSRCRRPGPAARGPRFPVHRGGRGVPCLLEDRGGGPQPLRGARHRADRPYTPADGCNRRLSPADDEEHAPRLAWPHHHASDAAAGSQTMRASSS